MKRIICTVFLLALVISLLALPVLAGPVYEDTLTEWFDDYFYLLVDDVNQCVSLSYLDFGANPQAGTTVAMPTNATQGSAFTYISYHCVVGESASSTEVTNGQISCLVMLGWNWATRTQHFANRTINGDTTVWNYYVEDPSHDSSITDIDMLKVKQETLS